MASISSLAFSPSSSARSTPLPSNGSKKRRGGDAVYVAAVPLRAAAGPAQLALSAAYSLGLWDLQHFVVAIQPSEQSQVFVLDFQPQDPETFSAAFMAISGRSIPGTILKRKIARIPKTRCWFIGYSLSDALKLADNFNEDWDSDLVVGRKDCRHYTNGLVEVLTGKENILDQLRDNF